MVQLDVLVVLQGPSDINGHPFLLIVGLWVIACQLTLGLNVVGSQLGDMYLLVAAVILGGYKGVKHGLVVLFLLDDVSNSHVFFITVAVFIITTCFSVIDFNGVFFFRVAIMRS